MVILNFTRLMSFCKFTFVKLYMIVLLNRDFFPPLYHERDRTNKLQLPFFFSCVDTQDRDHQTRILRSLNTYTT